MKQSFTLQDETAMMEWGAALSLNCKPGHIIYLSGVLGAGKTTVVQGFLRARGYSGYVKSPTYTLVEPYLFNGQEIFHFDLYRLSDPRELEFMGIRDYLSTCAIVLIEWPERGVGVLPPANLSCYIHVRDEQRQIEVECDDTWLKK